MSKWQRVMVTALLTAEMMVTLAPMVRGLFELPAPDVPNNRIRTLPRTGAVGQPPEIRQGVLIGTTMLLLFTAASALLPVWLRPQARTWVVTFTGTHVAAAGLGWVHDLPLLTLLALVSAVGVPLLVFARPHRGE